MRAGLSDTRLSKPNMSRNTLMPRSTDRDAQSSRQVSQKHAHLDTGKEGSEEAPRFRMRLKRFLQPELGAAELATLHEPVRKHGRLQVPQERPPDSRRGPSNFRDEHSHQ